MKLLEMKKEVLRLIEEISEDADKLTEDLDIEKKLNSVINLIMLELARIKRIPARINKDMDKENLIFDMRDLENFFQLHSVIFLDKNGEEKEIDMFESIIEAPCEGTLKLKYYKYPKRITKETNDEEYSFELSEDALGIMPYGVAADLLKNDVSSQYGKIYAEKYESMKQMLDPRYSVGMIYIEEA